MNRTALVVDDDTLAREYLAEALKTSGFAVAEAGTGEDGLARLRAGEPDLLLTDLRLPGIDGIAVLRGAKERHPDLPVVVLTAFGTIERAVEAMRAGAEDFLLKPVAPEQIEAVLQRVDARSRLLRENKALRASLAADGKESPVIVGSNPRFIQALALAERVAATEATVLVRGESGTGKELVAALLHHRGGRARGPFIRVNCAALTESLLTTELFGHEKGAFTGAVVRKEGRFELARGGTLFLDEIGELPAEVQAKLLRVLETREFERVGGTRTLQADVRVVAATNRDLEAGIAEGRFREDLFYRLNVVPIGLPPLRERMDDLPVLALHFLRRYQREYSGPARDFSADALAAMRRSEWPGNVRELANAVQRAVLVAEGPAIRAEDLGLALRPARRDPEAAPAGTLEEAERALILRTLDRTGWNRAEAARILDVTARTLSNKLKLWRARGLVPALAEEGG